MRPWLKASRTPLNAVGSWPSRWCLARCHGGQVANHAPQIFTEPQSQSQSQPQSVLESYSERLDMYRLQRSTSRRCLSLLAMDVRNM
jgi:hypothetical protein